jgi:hypothetical protein
VYASSSSSSKPRRLVTAGVDTRTVGGRLGQAGSGSTTLRVYSAWIVERSRQPPQTENPESRRAAISDLRLIHPGGYEREIRRPESKESIKKSAVL